MSRFDSYKDKFSCLRMRREDGILEMRLHTDDGPLRWGLIPHGELPDAFAEVGRDRDNRVVILTGTGDEFSGIRANVASRSLAQGITARAYDRVHWEGRALLMNLLNIECPVIAAINGPAFGWGLVVSLHCDIRFAARSALLNATFARLGIPGEKGSAWLLARLLGTARAADLLYTARRIDGTEAEKIGLVNAVLEDEALLPHVMAYARGIAAHSAPRSLAAMKAQIWTAIDDHYDVAFEAADHEQDLAIQTKDFREGIDSLREKRTPVFTAK
jgi:enoyl-CoA hydratase/carnithine racemase